MKRKLFITLTFIALFTICFAAVNDITGTWTGTLKSPEQGGSDFPLSYTFKVDSGKLTGTAHAPQGDVAITDGMINGNDFSFNVPVPNGNAPHTGKLYADSISLHLVYNGQHLHATLTKSK